MEPIDDRALSRRRLLRLGLSVGGIASIGGWRAVDRSSRRTAAGAIDDAATVDPSGRANRRGPRIDEPATAFEQADRIDPPDPPTPPGAFDQANLYVALYGFPGSSVLGALGEQGIAATVDRVRRVADAYVPFGRPVVPTFEIIASVASSQAGADGDYSNEFDVARFTPWIDAAEANGYHVVLDLQPGRARFPDQAREYEPLWLRPNVSIALDAEWRVRAPQRPGGGTIGTVDAAEVNETIAYVDDLCRRYSLPPKMAVLHQFTPSMVTNKPAIASTPHVRVVMHMDGFGSLALKRGSWQRMVDDLPPDALTGWKNFYDEDRPTPTPAETLANDPTPTVVTYQ